MFVQLAGVNIANSYTNFDIKTETTGQIGVVVASSSIQALRTGWYRRSFVTNLDNQTTSFGINLIASANASQKQCNPLSTTVYVVAPLTESNAIFTTSYIPTINAPVTRAADFQEIKTTYPAQLDLLGACVTRGHIGLPLASGETAGMARLGAEDGGLSEWGGELLIVS